MYQMYQCTSSCAEHSKCSDISMPLDMSWLFKYSASWTDMLRNVAETAKVLFWSSWKCSRRVEDHKDVLLIRQTHHNTHDTRLANTPNTPHRALHTPLDLTRKIQIRQRDKVSDITQLSFPCCLTQKQADNYNAFYYYVFQFQKVIIENFLTQTRYQIAGLHKSWYPTIRDMST